MKISKIIVNLVVVMAMLPLLFNHPLTAGPTYYWETFVWGPSKDEMLEGEEDGKEWAGEWNGQTGTFYLSDRTHVLGDFVWYIWGTYKADSPAGPWRYEGSYTFCTSDRVTQTTFGWYDIGHEGEQDYYHSQEVLATREQTWAEPHAVYLTNRPIPAPGALLLAGMGVGYVNWLRRRRTL